MNDLTPIQRLRASFQIDGVTTPFSNHLFIHQLITDSDAFRLVKKYGSDSIEPQVSPIIKKKVAKANTFKNNFWLTIDALRRLEYLGAFKVLSVSYDLEHDPGFKPSYFEKFQKWICDRSSSSLGYSDTNLIKAFANFARGTMVINVELEPRDLLVLHGQSWVPQTQVYNGNLHYPYQVVQFRAHPSSSFVSSLFESSSVEKVGWSTKSQNRKAAPVVFPAALPNLDIFSVCVGGSSHGQGANIDEESSEIEMVSHYLMDVINKFYSSPFNYDYLTNQLLTPGFVEAVCALDGFAESEKVLLRKLSQLYVAAMTQTYSQHHPDNHSMYKTIAQHRKGDDATVAVQGAWSKFVSSLFDFSKSTEAFINDYLSLSANVFYLNQYLLVEHDIGIEDVKKLRKGIFDCLPDFDEIGMSIPTSHWSDTRYWPSLILVMTWNYLNNHFDDFCEAINKHHGDSLCALPSSSVGGLSFGISYSTIRSQSQVSTRS